MFPNSQGLGQGTIFAVTPANITTFLFAPDHIFHAQLEQANQDKLAEMFAAKRRDPSLTALDKRR